MAKEYKQTISFSFNGRDVDPEASFFTDMDGMNVNMVIADAEVFTDIYEKFTEFMRSAGWDYLDCVVNDDGTVTITKDYRKLNTR